MRIIGLARGTGKTLEAMRIAASLDIYMVVSNKQEANRVFHVMGGKERNMKYPLTYDELLNRHFNGSFVKSVVIDNIDDFTYHVCKRLGVFPLVGTLTTEYANKRDIDQLITRLSNEN